MNDTNGITKDFSKWVAANVNPSLTPHQHLVFEYGVDSMVTGYMTGPVAWPNNTQLLARTLQTIGKYNVESKQACINEAMTHIEELAKTNDVYLYQMILETLPTGSDPVVSVKVRLATVPK